MPSVWEDGHMSGKLVVIFLVGSALALVLGFQLINQFS
jgi:hypothetical protein